MPLLLVASLLATVVRKNGRNSIDDLYPNSGCYLGERNPDEFEPHSRSTSLDRTGLHPNLVSSPLPFRTPPGTAHVAAVPALKAPQGPAGAVPIEAGAGEAARAVQVLTGKSNWE